MEKIYISINQFAKFTSSTPAGKKRILKQQQIPNKFLLPWYQTARAAAKRYCGDIKNTTPIDDAISILTSRVPANERQNIDKRVSLEALNELKSFAFPKLFRNIDFEIIRAEKKDILVEGVAIKIAPDVILKGVYRGKTVYGAVKIHICKGNPFDECQSKYVANLILDYLKTLDQTSDGEILPDLCLCLDIFGNRIMPASNSRSVRKDIKEACLEIKKLWVAA